MRSDLRRSSSPDIRPFEKFVGTRVKIFVTNRDMSKNDMFSDIPATNGIARGYGPRPYKRRRKGLRLAVIVVLLALAGMVYFQTSAFAQATSYKVDSNNWTAQPLAVCLDVYKNGIEYGRATKNSKGHFKSVEMFTSEKHCRLYTDELETAHLRFECVCADIN